MAARAPVIQRQLTRPSLLTRLFRFLSVLFLALVFSVLLEWLGMTIWWPEEGVGHSERMLDQELRYLNDDFKTGLAGLSPVALAGAAADWIDQLVEAIGFRRFIAWLGTASRSANGWGRSVLDLLAGLRVYLEAMLNVIQTFAVRLVVLVLATPVFALFGLVGLAEGLMRRDLRRWGGGRESSFIYHHSKKVLGPSILAAWMLYLATPFSIHPTGVLLPFAILFSVGIAVTAATFKKYL